MSLWSSGVSPDSRHARNRDIMAGQSFDDLLLQLQLNAALSGTGLDDTVAHYDEFGNLVVNRRHTAYGPIQSITPVPNGMQINRGDSTYGGGFAGAGGAPSGGSGPAAQPTPAGTNPGYSLGPNSQLGGVPNFYATGPGTAGVSTAPGGYTLGGLGSTAAPGTATGMGLGSNASLLGGTGNFAAGTGATAVTWGDRARQAWDAYQQYGGAVAGLAGGGGSGGFGGPGGSSGPLVTPPPPPDFSQSEPYQRGLANLLGVLGVQGPPITWPQFQGAPR